MTEDEVAAGDEPAHAQLGKRGYPAGVLSRRTAVTDDALARIDPLPAPVTIAT
jgi:hypothetical protein